MDRETMKKSYRAGIIGLGFIGAGDQTSGDVLGQQVKDLDGTHLAAYAGNPRVNIICGSSRNKGRRTRFLTRVHNEVLVYSDWKELVNSSKLDIISIATYTPTHAEMVIASAEAGIPVIYCEKPIAATMIEAERMLAACKKSGSLLVINHNRRFNPNFRLLQTMIARGDLGELTSVTARWPTGRLGNIGTHVIDVIHMITGQKTVAVSGILDQSQKPDCRGSAFKDPGGWGLIHLEKGCMVTVDAADYAKGPMVIEVYGTSGTISIIGAKITINLYNGSTRYLPQPTDQSSMDIAVGEMVAWLDARLASTESKNPPAFSYDPADAVHTLETIIAFHASDTRKGAMVELPLNNKDRDIILQSG
ncbi:MAG: Gfo/Idh/MocA family oxidoreductase [Spirochaetia bacterium]|nr:Gfo/Idh/MocA family oxidoreductase [Spirochaetia bacterium]